MSYETLKAESIGWWECQSGADPVTDLSASGVNGYLNPGGDRGTVTGPTDFLPLALNFASSIGRVRFDSPYTPFVSGGGARSFGGWVKCNAYYTLAPAFLIGQPAGYGSTGQGFEFGIYPDDYVELNFNGHTVRVDVSALVAIDEWHHYYVTCPVSAYSADVKVYIDGVQRATTTNSGASVALDTSFIGYAALGGAYYTQGSPICGFSSFNRQLSDAEVLSVYSGPVTVPSNDVAPVVSGTASSGVTLSCTTGSWTTVGSVSYAYQWTRSNSGAGSGEANISGATSSTYVLTNSDALKYVRCKVTATDDNGSTEAGSNFTAQVVGLPEITDPPQISNEKEVGQTNNLIEGGTWLTLGGGTLSYAYQWQRVTLSPYAASDISGATGTSYVIQNADIGKYLRCVVSATNTAGTTDEPTSLKGPVIGPPVIVANPTISGTLKDGEVLACTTGTWDSQGGGTLTYGYQWTRGEATIAGATSSTYELTPDDVGELVACLVRATNSVGFADGEADSVGPIQSSVPDAVLNGIDARPGISRTGFGFLDFIELGVGVRSLALNGSFVKIVEAVRNLADLGDEFPTTAPGFSRVSHEYLDIVSLSTRERSLALEANFKNIVAALNFLKTGEGAFPSYAPGIMHNSYGFLDSIPMGTRERTLAFSANMRMIVDMLQAF